jgi:hypothetical protein
MDGMKIEEFEELVISICSKSSVVTNTTVLNVGFTWVKIRAYLPDQSFVDISYNQETRKTTFAQIRDDRRVFGADNKKGWHWHSYEDPQRHEFTKGEIAFDEFLKRVEENLSK